MSLIIRYKERNLLIVKGSPMMILSKCTKENSLNKIEKTLKKLTLQGNRTIGMAYKYLDDE